MRHAATAQHGSTLRVFLAFLAVVAAIAGFEFYALRTSQQEHARPVAPATVAREPRPAGPDGAIDAADGGSHRRSPRDDLRLGAGPGGHPRRRDSRRRQAPFRRASALRGPTSPKAEARLSRHAKAASSSPATSRRIRRPPGVRPPRARDRRHRKGWPRNGARHAQPDRARGAGALGEPSRRSRRTPFYLLPALSGIDLGGAERTRHDLRALPVRNAARGLPRADPLPAHDAAARPRDYAFDPDWDPTRKCGARRIGDDSLNAVLAHARSRSSCRCW